MMVTSVSACLWVVCPLAVGGSTGISASQIVMLVLAVAALTLVMLSTRRRIRESKRAPRTPVRARYAQLQEQARATRGVEQVMLELDQLSRQIHGRLDTKLARLEALIRHADQRIEKLSRLSRAAGTAAFENPSDNKDTEELRAGESRGEDGRNEAIYRLADSGRSPLEIAREVGRTTGEVELILTLRNTKENERPSADLREPITNRSENQTAPTQ